MWRIEGRKLSAKGLRSSLAMLEMAWRSVVRMSRLQEGLVIKRRMEEKKLRRPSWLSQLIRDQLLRILGRAIAKRG